MLARVRVRVRVRVQNLELELELERLDQISLRQELARRGGWWSVGEVGRVMWGVGKGRAERGRIERVRLAGWARWRARICGREVKRRVCRLLLGRRGRRVLQWDGCERVTARNSDDVGKAREVRNGPVEDWRGSGNEVGSRGAVSSGVEWTGLDWIGLNWIEMMWMK